MDTSLAAVPKPLSTRASSMTECEEVVDISVSPGLTATSSFEHFYAENHESIARALAVTLGDSELASDAANEAMTRAYKRWSKISRYDKPAAWVYRVGLNWSLSWRQRRRRERDRPVSMGPEVGHLDTRDDSLDAAIDQLSVDHRAVVVCRIHLDWSVDQTAEALNIAPGTVKSRLARALAHLKVTINEEAEVEQAGGEQ